MSECGTGKTYVACAVVHELKTPTLVICPKIAAFQWHEAAAHFGDTISAIGYEKLRTGRTPFGTWERMPDNDDREYHQCQCCQRKMAPDDKLPCYAHHLGIHCIVVKRKPWDYGRFTFHRSIETVVFDEVQRCGGDSLNADMLIAAKRDRLRVLGLSATLASSPLQMRAIGYTLDLFQHPSQFLRWARQYGVRWDQAFRGEHWFKTPEQQTYIMGTIRDTILPSRGVRVTTASIPGFPEVDISSELYDLEESGRINEIYEEMFEALADLDKRSESDETPLTLMLRAQQRVELLKVPIVVELAQDSIEKGFSIGIFVNYRQTMDELRERLKCDCFIDGSPDGVRHRQRSIDRFQTHKSSLILVNTAAGGVGLSLPDLDGKHPRGGLVFPSYSAQTLKQVFGRFPRDSSKSKSFYRVLLAAKTADVKIHKALKAKLNNLDSLNDGDLMPGC